ncbi:MFS transporter (plasmid) [Streptomyces sp. BI20]|uniref:MFS transporter n=1 Tax=Streptomyces sp. BI20 TaxID=3403460 RepID=UPI003C72E094
MSETPDMTTTAPTPTANETTNPSTSPSARKGAGAGTTGGLLTISAAQFLIALDFSVIFVALPSMSAELGLSGAAAQWVVSAYSVFFAGFLILGGRLADRLGARTLFVAALGLFGVASLVGGIAAGAVVLLLARAAQGVAAATLQPAILSLLNTTFAAGRERTRAMAVWGTVGASGLAAGVVVGGLLTTLSWRWTFFVNLPFALVCVLAAPRFLRGGRAGGEAKPLNVISAVLCTATVLGFASALTFAADAGWTAPTTLIGFGVALLCLVVFAVRERVSAVPLIERSLRGTRTLFVGCVSTALYMASVAGVEFYLVTLFLQENRDMTPLTAGLAFLPLAVCITLGNMLAGRAIPRVGVGVTLPLAFLVGAGGLALLAFGVHTESYWLGVAPGLIVSGLGHGMIYTSMFVGGSRDVDDANQGVAGALMTTSQYAGGAVGVAVLVILLGDRPNDAAFLPAFLVAAGIAVIGALWGARGFAHLRGKEHAA